MKSAHYDRSTLLALGTKACSPSDIPPIPFDLKRCCSKNCATRRKRGRRGGLRLRLRRRKFKPALPTVTLANVRSLTNKMDELRYLATQKREYRNSCAICLSETWLNENITDEIIDIDGFKVFRGDRSHASRKSIGGGVCMYVNTKWCVNTVVKKSLCTPDLEVLCVSCRPFYLPREFCCVLFIVVYVPPSANVKLAADTIASIANSELNSKPNAAMIILGDFNSCCLAKTLPGFSQYVKCATRGQNTLDLVYCNTPHAFSVLARPPIGSSDHNVLHLLPAYKQKLKTHKPEARTITRLSQDYTDSLRGCLACTDWTVFEETCSDLDELTDVVSSYINFCCDLFTERKTIKIYPNSKPWMTKEAKTKLKEKHSILRTDDPAALKRIQKEVSREVKKGKAAYREKLRKQLEQGDVRGAWQSLNTITDRKARQPLQDQNPQELADQLNKFYNRFDAENTETEAAPEEPPPKTDSHLQTEESEVRQYLKRCPTRRAPGPDGISGLVLKTCADELAPILCRLFNRSFKECHVPTLWKRANIVPIPKKKNAKELNDFRPIALTATTSKIMEKMVQKHLAKTLKDQLDPMQFAYQPNRDVEDAVLTLVHNTLSHAESPNAYTRILFIDFSSAFNTIRPTILKKKMASLQVNECTIKWILNFMTNRQQYVTVGNVSSSTLTTSTGAPQGCVLSPLCYNIYTNDFTSQHDNCLVLKYADDTAIAGFITKSNESNYIAEVEHLAEWCRENYLQLNVKKTKELIVNFRKENNHLPIKINNEEVEQVKDFRYLGITMDCHLTWTVHTNCVLRKVNQRLYLLRRLNQFGVEVEALRTFYRAVVESCMTFGACVWVSGATQEDRKRLDRLCRSAARIVGPTTSTIEKLGKSKIEKKAATIQKDPTHPLGHFFQLLPSGRRLRSARARTTRMQNSFIPTAIRLSNQGRSLAAKAKHQNHEQCTN